VCKSWASVSSIVNGSFCLRVGKMRALAFPPIGDVTRSFDSHVGEFQSDEWRLVGYFAKVWVGDFGNNRRVRKPPQFELALWSVHYRAITGRMLTNNKAENVHRIYGQRISDQSHPQLLFLKLCKRRLV